MFELRELKDVERRDGVLYLHFSRLPIARSKSYANGEINGDLDHYNEVVGIEILSLEPEETQALAEVANEYRLSLDKLTQEGRRA
jgi:Protein of unknown function (DUF2283)